MKRIQYITTITTLGLCAACSNQPEADRQKSTQLPALQHPMVEQPFALTENRNAVTYTGNLLIWDRDIDISDMRDMIDLSNRRFAAEDQLKRTRQAHEQAIRVREQREHALRNRENEIKIEFRTTQVSELSQWFDTELAALGLNENDQMHAQKTFGFYCQAKLFELAINPLILDHQFRFRPTPAIICEPYYQAHSLLNPEAAVCQEEEGPKDFFACLWQEGVLRLNLFENLRKQDEVKAQIATGELRDYLRSAIRLKILRLKDTKLFYAARNTPSELIPSSILSALENTDPERCTMRDAGAAELKLVNLEDRADLIEEQIVRTCELARNMGHLNARSSNYKDTSPSDALFNLTHAAPVMDLDDVEREKLDGAINAAKASMPTLARVTNKDDVLEQNEEVQALRNQLATARKSEQALEQPRNEAEAQRDQVINEQALKATTEQVALALFEPMHIEVQRDFRRGLLVATFNLTSKAEVIAQGCFNLLEQRSVTCPGDALPAFERLRTLHQNGPAVDVEMNYHAESGQLEMEFALNQAQDMGIRYVERKEGNNVFNDIADSLLETLRGRIKVYPNQLTSDGNLSLLTGDFFLETMAGETTHEGTLRLFEAH